MTARQATILVSDEVTYSLSGKLNIFGTYTADIQIFDDPTPAVQLVFLFIIETDPNDPYQSLELEIALPGMQKNRMAIPVSRLVPSHSDKMRWCLKYPFLVVSPLLRPGPIEAKIIHEKGEISVAGPTIVLRPRTGPMVAVTG
jgi:hypothetical protein